MTNGEITNLQRAVLRALMCGKTDGKIAAELYVGRRTMHRWLKKLMEEAGATNRFALGAHAARNGWLEERDNHAGRTALPLINRETPDGDDGMTLMTWSSRPSYLIVPDGGTWCSDEHPPSFGKRRAR
jgi:hypothetical protein